MKKAYNRGFSLVELVVVIAIMAVLIGVMAPTFIKNVEKSRESVDVQTLDTVRQSVVTALSTEHVYSQYVTVVDETTPYVTYMDNINNENTNLDKELRKEVDSDGILNAQFKSKACKDAKIKITIFYGSKVKVEAEGAGTTKSNINMVVE